MSNQNNSMQNLDLRSSVNLNRYKKSISGNLMLNGCNMPVVGDKYTPMKKEYVTDKEYILEHGKNITPYGRFLFDRNQISYDDRFVDRLNEASEVQAIGICANTDQYIKGYYYHNNENIFYKNSETNEIIPIYTDEIKTIDSFVTYFFLDFDLLIVNKKICIKFDRETTPEYTDIYTSENNDILGCVKLRNIYNYVSEEVYNERNTYFSYYIFTDKRLISIDDFSDVLTTTDGEYLVNGNYPIENVDVIYSIGSDVKSYAYDEDSHTIKTVAGNSELHIVRKTIYKIKENLTGSLSVLEYKLTEDGVFFTQSFKYGSEDNFKLFSFNKHFELNGGCIFLTSLEMEKLVDNNIYISRTSYKVTSFPYIMQGASFISVWGLPIDSINQNFKHFSISDFTYVDGIFRLKNGRWVSYKDYAEFYCTPLEPLTIGDSIYFPTGIMRTNDISIEYINHRNITDRNFEAYNLYWYGDNSKVYESNSDWYAQALYWVIGNKPIFEEDPFMPQLAPVLSCVGDDTPQSEYFYIQRNNEDSTLYNSKNEQYIAPTDNDFFIPLMPTDKILGSVLNDILIKRADGSTAILTKYNNSYLPVYYYSTVSRNADYSFVCQGQVFNVINGIICSSDGVGIIDVSDQTYLGSNGVLALFYNDRNKKIYSFAASNSLEELISCDNIKEILQADLSNTSDEIYIFYKTYDSTNKLICIDSDGQIYTLVEGDVEKFQVGFDGVYIWSNKRKNYEGMEIYIWDVYKYRILTIEDELSNINNYIETNYFGTDEFKKMTVDRLYLRLTPINQEFAHHDVIVNMSMLTLDGEVFEQYTITDPEKEYFRISPRQKNCLGISVKVENLKNYTVAALSIGLTDDSVITTNDKMTKNVINSRMFD